MEVDVPGTSLAVLAAETVVRLAIRFVLFLGLFVLFGFRVQRSTEHLWY